MVALIFGEDKSPLLAQWAASRIPHVGAAGFGPCQAIGIASGPYAEDELYGVLVAHDWQEQARTLQISMAARSPKWALGLRPLFHCLFDNMHALKIWTATPHTAARTLRFNVGIGMQQEAILRHHFGPGRHAVICSMMEAEYRHSRWCPKIEEAA